MNTNTAQEITREAFFEAFGASIVTTKPSQHWEMTEDQFKTEINQHIVYSTDHWHGWGSEDIQCYPENKTIINAEHCGITMDNPGFDRFCKLIREKSHGELWVQPFATCLWTTLESETY